MGLDAANAINGFGSLEMIARKASEGIYRERGQWKTIDAREKAYRNFAFLINASPPQRAFYLSMCELHRCYQVINSRNIEHVKAINYFISEAEVEKNKELIPNEKWYLLAAKTVTAIEVLMQKAIAKASQLWKVKESLNKPQQQPYQPLELPPQAAPSLRVPSLPNFPQVEGEAGRASSRDPSPREPGSETPKGGEKTPILQPKARKEGEGEVDVDRLVEDGVEPMNHSGFLIPGGVLSQVSVDNGGAALERSIMQSVVLVPNPADVEKVIPMSAAAAAAAAQPIEAAPEPAPQLQREKPKDDKKGWLSFLGH